MLTHRQAGDEIVWLIASKAWTPRWSEETIARKEAEITAVASFYEVNRLVRLGLPASRMDELPFGDVLTLVAESIKQVQPDEVYTVHAGDVHSDHRVLADAVWRSLKPFRGGKGVRRILSYETLSSTDQAAPTSIPFRPTVYRDITAVLDRKIEAMQLYQSELQPLPGPRNGETLRALARCRGASVDVECAEAFMLLRQVDH